jgi:hypothetical protein
MKLRTLCKLSSWNVILMRKRSGKSNRIWKIKRTLKSSKNRKSSFVWILKDALTSFSCCKSLVKIRRYLRNGSKNRSIVNLKLLLEWDKLIQEITQYKLEIHSNLRPWKISWNLKNRNWNKRGSNLNYSSNNSKID